MEEKTFEEKCELVLREAFYETPIFYNYLKEIIEKAIQGQAKVIVQLADVTDKEIEEYIDRYIDMGCFRNPEIARPYLLDGFQLGCKYMESKLSKLPE